MSGTDFGVIICTCKFDYFLAKGCCASVRRFLPDAPITLFVDDDLDPSPLCKAYGASVMYRRDVKDPFLREVNRGWGLPKMTLFWESPYERFLYLDCDTVLWGDVVGAHGGAMDWDMVIDVGDKEGRPWRPGSGTLEMVNSEYFDTGVMSATYPQFTWQRYVDQLFCTGTYFARRGIFQLEEYKQVLETGRKTPGLSASAEMGMLNYMIFNGVEHGGLKVERRPMQMVSDFYCEQYSREWFRLGAEGPVVLPEHTQVVHFTDPKPISGWKCFHEPMTYFRLEAARQINGLRGAAAKAYLRAEEAPWRFTKFYRRRFGNTHQAVKRLLTRKR
jgi:hypothetical protein